MIYRRCLFLILFCLPGHTWANGCIGKQMRLLWNMPAEVSPQKVQSGRVLMGDLSEVIVKNAGVVDAEQIFARVETLSPNELKIFKEELRAGSWKWICD